MSTGVWNLSDISSQNERNIIITGSTSGIGLETARELARAGANITLAARNPEKAKAVIQKLEKGSTAGWGRLKSGVGWISLNHARKV